MTVFLKYTNQHTIDFIKNEEGFDEIARHDYGQWSLGHGNGKLYKTDGTFTTVKQGMSISKEKADFFLKTHILIRIEPHLSQFDKFDLNLNQLGGIISWAYNKGEGHLPKLRTAMEDGRESKIKDVFWNSGAAGSNSKRRQREWDLLMGGYSLPLITITGKKTDSKKKISFMKKILDFFKSKWKWILGVVGFALLALYLFRGNNKRGVRRYK